MAPPPTSGHRRLIAYSFDVHALDVHTVLLEDTTRARDSLKDVDYRETRLTLWELLHLPGEDTTTRTEGLAHA